MRQSSHQNLRVKNAWSLTETSGKKGYFEIITEAKFVSVCVQTAKAANGERERTNFNLHQQYDTLHLSSCIS